MKNKKFFYQQYNKIDWQNQEKTKLNFKIYDYVISNVIRGIDKDDIAVFDIGFGIGAFFRALSQKLDDRYKSIHLEGCEPSKKNYEYFIANQPKHKPNISLVAHNETFLHTKTDLKFDIITAIYVFPHFDFSEVEEVAQKILSMIQKGGRFVLVVANERYLEEKLNSERDLFIERSTISFGGKDYKEVLHYSNLPEIGQIIDYNREDAFYIDFFNQNGFTLESRNDINDAGFIATLFVFKKAQGQ